MFLSDYHKNAYLELAKENLPLNKGQLYILAFDKRLQKMFFSHVCNQIVDWEGLLADSNLTDDERILFSLIHSFHEKTESSFTVNQLYRIENVDYLKVSLTALYVHFSLDIYPYDFSKNDLNSIIKSESESERLVSQKDIADMLNQHGIPGDVRKVSAYKSKGYLPDPDVTAGNGDLWRESKIKEWIAEYKAGKIVKRRNRGQTQV